MISYALVSMGFFLFAIGIALVFKNNLRIIREYNALYDKYLQAINEKSAIRPDSGQHDSAIKDSYEKKIHSLEADLKQARIALEEAGRKGEKIQTEYKQYETALKNELNIIIDRKNNEIESLKTIVKDLNARFESEAKLPVEKKEAGQDDRQVAPEEKQPSETKTLLSLLENKEEKTGF
jgi:hypothetical protein